MAKIAVLVSGGVDSSVSLKLLQEMGHEVTAFYLKIWLEDELTYLNQCPWEEDLAYLRPLCQDSKIPLEVISMQRAYFDKVVSFAVDEVRAGRTPNPDVFCNQQIKFGIFLESISGFEFVASGHYAQVGVSAKGNYVLRESPDSIKDQTYFLVNLNKQILPALIFPIGSYTKTQVRELATKFKLPNQSRKDSQGICFLGKFNYRDFIRHYLGTKEGPLVEFETGKQIGKHSGFWFYTIGQRKNIGLSGGPWYVVSKDPGQNIVYISKHYHESHHTRDRLKVSSLNWFEEPEIHNLQVKLRHGANKYNCKISPSQSGGLELHLDGQDQGIAEGQFVAFYQNGYCLGGGVISGT